MRLIRTIIFLTLLAYSVLFCVENFQMTSLTIPFVTKFESIPQFLVILSCVILGVLIGSLIGTVKDIKNHFSGASVRNENKSLKKKLDIYETEKTIQQNLLNE